MSVLEIGTATGFLLEAIRDQVGNTLVGIEPGDAFRDSRRHDWGSRPMPIAARSRAAAST